MSKFGDIYWESHQRFAMGMEGIFSGPARWIDATLACCIPNIDPFGITPAETQLFFETATQYETSESDNIEDIKYYYQMLHGFGIDYDEDDGCTLERKGAPSRAPATAALGTLGYLIGQCLGLGIAFWPATCMATRHCIVNCCAPIDPYTEEEEENLIDTEYSFIVPETVKSDLGYCYDYNKQVAEIAPQAYVGVIVSISPFIGMIDWALNCFFLPFLGNNSCGNDSCGVNTTLNDGTKNVFLTSLFLRNAANKYIAGTPNAFGKSGQCIPYRATDVCNVTVDTTSNLFCCGLFYALTRASTKTCCLPAPPDEQILPPAPGEQIMEDSP